ncbi:MAG: response regulator transcription factor [Actinobacteria bacterium]|nr:response regulator transcription factor [Actinomycetota bacterium]
MHRKNILIVTSGLETSSALRRVLSSMDVSVSFSTSAAYREVITTKKFDLVITDIGRDIVAEISKMENYLSEDEPVSLLVITEVELLASLRLPTRITADFVIRQASDEEYTTRVRHLLWPSEEATSSDLVRVGALTVNLATYQVYISGEPLDLTYLEYALLAFMVTHPGRTYSRDALLRRVWGFEYYGGSRTVDVHVRRVRAKLGPEYAQRLETVRGVGYLWNA